MKGLEEEKATEKVSEDKLRKALKLIADIAVDYDGFRGVEGLKSLIDEIREVAKEGLKDDS